MQFAPSLIRWLQSRIPGRQGLLERAVAAAQSSPGLRLVIRAGRTGRSQPNPEEVFMTKLVALAGLALVLTVGYATAQQNTMSAGRPSAVLTPDQCNTIWSKAA